MRSSRRIIFVIVFALLIVSCNLEKPMSTSSDFSFLYLYGENVILTDSTFNTCFDIKSILDKEPYFIPNAHYCVTQEFVDSILRSNPLSLREVEPSDSLLSVLVTCVPIDTFSLGCSTLYSTSSEGRIRQRSVDSVLIDKKQIFWYFRMPELSSKIINPISIETDFAYYTTYTYQYEYTTRVDTLLTNLNIFLRACEGC